MGKGKQASWGGRFSGKPAEHMLAFSESVSFDARLAPYDILGSKAHARMLASVGLIPKKSAEAICKGLDKLATEIEAGSFVWKPELEDVHMNLEQALTERVPEAAGLHTARSRNDQVATDMRLFFKDACEQLRLALAGCMEGLLNLSEANENLCIPGYTHLQRAQPVSIAHHLLAYVEMFGRDRERFGEIFHRANVCPLGSGAIAGTTLSIDRTFVAKELGFVDSRGRPRLSQNSMDAVADRDLAIEFASACSIAGMHLSRLAEDVILWNSSEFGFIVLPDAYTTGSSLMPQKKNPDSFELIRGKSARLQAAQTQLLLMSKGLPLTYNRDLQEDKPPVFDCLDTLTDCLLIARESLEGATFQEEACRKAVNDPVLLATDLVDYLVEQGVPFRDAHHVIGALVAESEKRKCPLNELPQEVAEKVHEKLGPDWVLVFDLQRALKRREQPGMPGPRQVRRQIARWRKALA